MELYLNSFFHNKEVKKSIIDLIVVNKSFFRNYIGSTMILHAFRHMTENGFNTCIGNCLEKNERAQNFCISTGAVLVGKKIIEDFIPYYYNIYEYSDLNEIIESNRLIKK